MTTKKASKKTSKKSSKASRARKRRVGTTKARSRTVAAGTIQVESGTGRLMADGRRCYWIWIREPDGTRRRVKVCE